MTSLRTRRPRLDSDSFIAAAESEPAPSPKDESASRSEAAPSVQQSTRAKADGSRRGSPKPWEGPSVRADVAKTFNLRLPEPLKLKLDFIREQTRVSVHEFIMTALVPAVDLEIERLERRKKS